MDYLYACLTEGTPKLGSIYYYAYRLCDERVGKGLYALDQLKYQWFKASELYLEPYPSLQKLQWWQNELSLLNSTQSSHPILQLLKAYFSSDYLINQLTADLTYALTTLAEGRDYQQTLDLSQSFLGIATLKANILGFDDARSIQTLNHVDELLRHILLIGKHVSRNICLNKNLQPSMDRQLFQQITKSLLVHAQTTYQQLSPNKSYIKPLVLLHKQQYMCAKKIIHKVHNPFTESIIISPIALLFSTLFISKL